MKNKLSLLYDEVVSMENLFAAWEDFIRGKRRKVDVQAFARDLYANVASLHDDLCEGAYRHGPYQAFNICDPKPRRIHKASVRDRLLHHVIHRKLYPYFAARFISDSFSCQTGKGLYRAINRFRRMAWKAGRNYTRTCWVLKCDIRKFFASVDHGILMDVLRLCIADVRLLRLLEEVIGSFETSSGKGLPLGNLTSQLFANIYMDRFDRFVKMELGVKRYIRYADDFVLLSDDRGSLLSALPKLHTYFSDHLELEMHPDKISIETIASGVDFLGWVHFLHHRVPRTKTRRSILKRIRKHPTCEVLQSYLGLLKHGDAFGLRTILLNDYWFWRG